MSSSRFTLVALGLAFVVALETVYRLHIFPAYAYMGFKLEGFYTPTHLLLDVAAALPCVYLPTRLRNPSDLVVWGLYLLVYAPTVIVLPNVFADKEAAVLMVALLFAALLLLDGICRIPRTPIRQTTAPRATFVIVSIILFGLCYVIIFANFELSLSLPSLSEVYDVRSDFKGTSGRGGRFAGYAVSWTGNVLTPLIFTYGIVYRRFTLVAGALFTQVVLFSLTAFKAALGSPLLLLFVYFAIRRRDASFGHMALIGALSVVLFAIVEQQVLGTAFLGGVVVRRLFFIPGLLTSFYFEFFSNNPHTMFANSIVGALFEYPYDLAPPHLIGYEYFNRAHMSANANPWADGYAGMGAFGVLAMSAILGAILWLYDSVALGKDVRFTVPMLAMPTIVWTNSALFTGLATHGIGAVVLLVFFFPPLHEDDRGADDVE
jgi:hypothetical protein